MSKIHLLEEQQTSHGIFRKTIRLVKISEGHTVTVTHWSLKNSRLTWAERSHAYSKVAYECECTRRIVTGGTFKNSQIANHDSWMTETKLASRRSAIIESLNKEGK